jgi:nucleotide-binding universal stress UspA family protein
MYSTLLVALDGTPASQGALAPARTLARVLGAQLVEVVVPHADAADAIVAEAEARHADLIVMARSGGWERVMSLTNVPLLLAPAGVHRMWTFSTLSTTRKSRSSAHVSSAPVPKMSCAWWVI